MNKSRVTIICVCYNHARFVQQALESAIRQDYPNVELIVIDDASTDNSVEIITKWIGERNITFLQNEENLGYCKTFNRALAVSQGEYIIDLSGDDELKPNRVTSGVEILTRKGATYGVTFSDADYIDEQGNFLSRHSDRFAHTQIPSGDIYKEVITRYFICSPTLMFIREVIEELNGYDEALTYEDFDFWIRAARKFKFIYVPEPLVRKRRVPNSLGQMQFKLRSSHALTTLRVCEKIQLLNRTAEEGKALDNRIWYELGSNLKLLNLNTAWKFLRLYISNRNHTR